MCVCVYVCVCVCVGTQDLRAADERVTKAHADAAAAVDAARRESLEQQGNLQRRAAALKQEAVDKIQETRKVSAPSFRACHVAALEQECMIKPS